MGSGTNLGRVRGLGSAQEGAHHWIMQRVTAVGNLVLVVWLLVSLLRLPNYDHAVLIEWLASPLVAVPMGLLLVSLFWHIRLGLQVLIEDYIHEHGTKFGLILLLNFFVFGGAALGIFSIAKVAFTGEPS